MSWWSGLLSIQLMVCHMRFSFGVAPHSWSMSARVCCHILRLEVPGIVAVVSWQFTMWYKLSLCCVSQHLHVPSIFPSYTSFFVPEDIFFSSFAYVCLFFLLLVLLSTFGGVLLGYVPRGCGCGCNGYQYVPGSHFRPRKARGRGDSAIARGLGRQLRGAHAHLRPWTTRQLPTTTAM